MAARLGLSAPQGLNHPQTHLPKASGRLVKVGRPTLSVGRAILWGWILNWMNRRKRSWARICLSLLPNHRHNVIQLPQALAAMTSSPGSAVFWTISQDKPPLPSVTFLGYFPIATKCITNTATMSKATECQAGGQHGSDCKSKITQNRKILTNDVLRFERQNGIVNHWSVNIINRKTGSSRA